MHAKTKFYAVAKGEKCGVFTDWLEVKKYVNGVRPSLYEAFDNRRQAEEFVRSHRDHHEGAKQKLLRKKLNKNLNI